MMVTGIVVIGVICLVLAGVIYRFHAVDLLPAEPPPKPLPCSGCGGVHCRENSLRWRLYRFLTLPFAGLIFLVLSPFRRTRQIVIIAEVALVLANRVSLGLVGEMEANQQYVEVGLKLGLKEEELRR